MSLEVIFCPLRRIVIEKETGEILEEHIFQSRFKPVNWPQWICYEDSPSWFADGEKRVEVLDVHTNAASSIFVSLSDLEYRNDSAYMFLGNPELASKKTDVMKYFRNYDRLIQAFRSLCQNQETFIDHPSYLERFQKAGERRHISKWEDLALQIASIYAFIHPKSFFCFSLKHDWWPIRGVSLGPQGEVFLDLPNHRLGSGGSRFFELAIWLNDQVMVAKGVLQFVPDDLMKRQVTIERNALDALNKKPGIIRTYDHGILPEKGGKSSFFVFQELHRMNLFEFIRKGLFCSFQEKEDLMGQLLEGLVAIAEKGAHCDICLQNILVSRSAAGKIKGTITDFGLFASFQAISVDVRAEYAPPDYHKNRLRLDKLDVWMLGLVFLMICCERAPAWSRLKDCKQMVNMISQVSSDWPRVSLEKRSVPPFFTDLICAMLKPDPAKRCSPEEALKLFQAERSK